MIDDGNVSHPLDAIRDFLDSMPIGIRRHVVRRLWQTIEAGNVFEAGDVFERVDAWLRTPDVAEPEFAVVSRVGAFRTLFEAIYASRFSERFWQETRVIIEGELAEDPDNDSSTRALCQIEFERKQWHALQGSWHALVDTHLSDAALRAWLWSDS